MKKRIPLFLFIVALIIIGANNFYNDNTKYIENETQTGNTGGNLNNGGYFCEFNNKVYFNNYLDNGSLYVMDSNQTNFKKIRNDVSSYINVLDNYIFYSRNNNLVKGKKNTILRGEMNGIYRIDFNGKNVFQLFNNPCKVVNVTGNYVYYQHYTDNTGVTFYKVKIDGKEETKISDLSINPASSFNGKIYYTGVDLDHYIYSYNINTDSTEIIYKGNCFNSVLHNGYIYFISVEDNYNIARVDLNGENKEVLINEHCFTFNLNDDYLYYQVDDGNNSKICVSNIDGTNQVKLMDGNFNSINVTSTFVYFKELNSEQFYELPVDGSYDVKLFSPLVLN